MNPKKRILSIDGGGVRGALTACFLVKLEQQVGKPCREIFDFVAGTSTGALIAAAIAAGVPATRILEIYTQRAGEIFNVSPLLTWPARFARGYAFKSANVVRVLQGEFGAAASWTLNDCPIRILLTARGVNGQTWYFVRDGDRNSQYVGGASLDECAAASAAAPTYFTGLKVNPANGHTIGWCFDGGAGDLGNPVYQACVEAFAYDDFTPETTSVISLGTGYYPSADPNPPCGLLATLSWTLDSLLNSASDQQSELVNRHYPGVMQRFNWKLPHAIDMAAASAIPELVAIGRQLSSQMDWASIL